MGRVGGVWFAAAFFPLIGCSGPGPAAPGGTESLAPRFENHDPAVAYVGGEACRRCHVAIAGSFAHTGMGRSAYRLTRATAIEDFGTRNTVEDARTGVRYRMTTRDGRFYMRQSILDASGREGYVDEREMVHVIGSGNHSRSYVTEKNGRLYEMPVCWYPALPGWDLCPGFQRNNGHFARKISDSCVFCHAGRMELQGAETNLFTGPPIAVDCERCHGPGAKHIEKWDGGEPPRGGPDPTIVNPRRLPPDLRMQVCFQCHLGDSKATERVDRAARRHADWRPGMSVHEAFVPFEYKDPTEAFGISSHGERLMRSRCFRESGGGIECLSCHDPHVPVYDAHRAEDAFTKTCRSCHAQDACKETAQARAATNPKDDCVACHMPKAEVDDHPHALFTDHWIRRRPGRHDDTARASLNVVPVLPRDFAALSKPEQAYHAGRALFGLSTDYPPGPEKEALLAASVGALRAAMQQGIDGAEVWKTLGKTQRALARQREAADSLANARSRDASDGETVVLLGRALTSSSRLADAEAVFRTWLDDHPRDGDVLAELGHTLAATSRFEEAITTLERALAAGAVDARIQGNIAFCLSHLGRADAAIASARQSAALDPESAEIWRVYAEVAEAAGRAGEATFARERSRMLSRLRRAPAGMMSGMEGVGGE